MVQTGLGWDGVCPIQQGSPGLSTGQFIRISRQRASWNLGSELDQWHFFLIFVGQDIPRASQDSQWRSGLYPLTRGAAELHCTKDAWEPCGPLWYFCFCSTRSSPLCLVSMESHHMDSKLLPEVFSKKIVWLKNLISFTCLEDILSFCFILNIYGVGGIQGMVLREC